MLPHPFSINGDDSFKYNLRLESPAGNALHFFCFRYNLKIFLRPELEQENAYPTSMWKVREQFAVAHRQSSVCLWYGSFEMDIHFAPTQLHCQKEHKEVSDDPVTNNTYVIHWHRFKRNRGSHAQKDELKLLSEKYLGSKWYPKNENFGGQWRGGLFRAAAPDSPITLLVQSCPQP